MANEIVEQPKVAAGLALPAHLQGITNDMATTAVSEIGGAGFPRIGRNNNPPWHKQTVKGEDLPITDAEGNPAQGLYVIALAANNLAKRWYKGVWKPDVSGPPNCHSFDRQHPSGDSPEPQSYLCAMCSHNGWNSNGRGGKACSDNVILAVMFPNQGSYDRIYQLSLTPTDLSNWKDFCEGLKKNGYPLEGVIIQITFTQGWPHAQYQFAIGGFINEEMQQWAEKHRAERATNTIDDMLGLTTKAITAESFQQKTGVTVQTTGNAADAPLPVQQPAPSPAQSQPVQATPVATPPPTQPLPPQPATVAPGQPVAPVLQPAPALQPVPTEPAPVLQPAPTEPAPILQPAPTEPAPILQPAPTGPAPVLQSQVTPIAVPAPDNLGINNAPQPQPELAPEQQLDAALAPTAPTADNNEWNDALNTLRGQ